TKCIGCLKCVSACKQVHNLEMDVPRIWDRNDGLSAENWTSVIRRPGDHYVRKQCRHCLEPACASVCPVGALHKTEIGAVTYDITKCLGCRYCMMACPFGIPRYDWDKTVPHVEKCILCYDRIKTGQQPACTEACPVGATIFGDRDELLEVAHKRIKENPAKYIDKVWGEHEVGGTSVLYLSDIYLDFLTYPTRPGDKPLPKETAAAMESVPFAFVGMGGAMLGLNWIIRRRMKMDKERGNKKESADE
ncbi:MAG: 4Fe-4S dicluster domain-containing protein, partial [Bacteroidetes bacterium]|nr:4Fe-4S dicluster domain-containing protein [Bacteroidota bacterium]